MLLISSTIFSYQSFTDGKNNKVFAAESTHDDGTGGMINPENPQEFEDSIISKNATYTGTPGEYFIDLNIKGKDQEITEPTDIVIVYDNSNSMQTNNRVGVAYDATVDFINQMLTNENENIRMALVSFGTYVMDGQRNQMYGGTMGNFSYKTLTNDPSSIIEKLPANVPTDRGRGNNGGTYTQEALVEAQDILAGSDADNKVVITITDGVPTISHDGNRIQGNGTKFSYGNSNHGTNTINAAKGIQSSGIDMHSIGVEIFGDAGATQAEAKYVMENIASTPTRYHNAEQVDEIVDILSQVATGFLATIDNGTVTDPMGELVDLSLIGEDFVSASDDSLSDGDYYLSASEAALLDGVTVSLDGETITLDNLNLAAGESINLRYKVHLDTENENFEGNEYFETNGTTTLAPRADSDIVREFEVPSIKGPALEVSGTKIWEDIGGESNRPDEIEIDLYRSTDGGQEEFVETAAIATDENNELGYIFEGYPMYSSRGLLYDYYVKEVTVDGYETSYSDDGLDITNTLIAEPSINLVKTSNKEIISEVGEEVTYTFEVENTGNVVLDNIVLNDPMLGGGIELENTTLEPGGTTTVSVNHTVTQEDLNQSDVENVASVTGEDPSDNPVEDDDTVTIPTDQVPSINLVKTADRDDLVADEAINYTFTATNTGNVTLTDVNISDVLEGLSDIQYQTIDGEPIEDVENITLQPGQVLVATADYTITQGDVDSGVVDNHATVAGTPPNTDEPVEAEDNVTVPQDIEGALTLEKTSDVDEIIEAGQSVVYTFLITNTSNVTMNDIVLDDPMLGGNIELPETELVPGASTTVDVEYQVTQADMDNGNIENIATVNGTDPRGNEHEDEDSDEIPVKPTPETELESGISLEKIADTEEIVEVGQEVTYTFEITNTGETNLENITLTDEMLGGNIDMEQTALAPGESMQISAKYMVKEADLENDILKNVATVTGMNPEDPESGNPPTDEDEVETPVNPPTDVEENPGISLVKDSNVDNVTEIGEVITYTFTIENIGDVELGNVILNDPMLGGDLKLENTVLAPGEQMSVSQEHTVTEEQFEYATITNKALVTGDSPSGDRVESTDEVKVTTESKQPDEEKPDLVTAKSVNGKGSHTVSDNNEVFTYEIETIIDDSLDIDSFNIADSVDNRIAIDSVDVMIDQGVTSVASKETEELMEKRIALEEELLSAKDELEVMLNALESQEKETDEVTEEEPSEETAEESNENVPDEKLVEESTEEVTEESTTEEPTTQMTEETTTEESTEEVTEESTTEEPTTQMTEETTTEESTEEKVEEVQESTDQPVEELQVETDTKAEIFVNEKEVSKLEVLIEDLESQIAEINNELESLENDLTIPAGSITDYGDLNIDDQNINFSITDKDVIEALKGERIRLTISASFGNIDENALTNGIDNTATVIFGDDPKETNTVTVKPVKPTEPETPTPEEPSEEPKPEEPAEEVPEESKPEEQKPETEVPSDESEPEESTEESKTPPTGHSEEPKEEVIEEQKPEKEEPSKGASSKEETVSEEKAIVKSTEKVAERQPEKATASQPNEETVEKAKPKEEETLPNTGEANGRNNYVIFTLVILGLAATVISFVTRRRKQ